MGCCSLGRATLSFGAALSSTPASGADTTRSLPLPLISLYSKAIFKNPQVYALFASA